MNIIKKLMIALSPRLRGKIRRRAHLENVLDNLRCYRANEKLITNERGKSK